MKIKAGLINKLVAQHKQLGVDAGIKIIDAIDASITRLGLSADTSPVSKLAVAIELGDFIIQRLIADGVLVDDMSAAVDQFVMDFLKSLSDTVAPIDSMALSVEKPMREDSLDLGDYVTLLTNKAPDDAVGTFDSIDKLDTTKSLNHTTAISSHLAKALSKPLQDESALTDTLAFLTDKSFLDSSSIGDSDVLAVGKYLANTASLVEHLRYTLERRITEDAYGVFDRAFLKPGKHLVENGAVSDIHQVHTNKSLSDSLYISEFFLHDGRDKEYDSAAGIGDTLAITSSKQLSDPSSVTEFISKATTTSLTDAYGVSDEFVKALTFNRRFDDITMFADDMALLSQGYVADAFYFADDYIGASRTA
jgi:hypothetical protein